MSLTIHDQKGGRISRWLRNLFREVLEDHDRSKYVTIHSNRDPDERDILYHPGAQWHNQVKRKRYILKEIKAEWKELPDEK